MTETHEAVICGAGMAGVSAAYFLCKAGMRDILLVDERPPLSFTSDRSTECYRNWWPDPEMLALMNCSIDLMEQLADESGNVFQLNRRGYLYITGDESKLPALKTKSQKISELGGGELRIHSAAQSCYQPARAEGFHDQPDGADLLIGQELIHKHFPYLTDKAAAALHARRAGWLSAQQLGMYLLEQARAMGVKFMSAQVEAVELSGGHVRGVGLSSGERVEAPLFINAAGPYFKTVGKMLGADLPVETELHLKVVMKDALGVVGRDAPLLIWDDTQLLPWSSEERAALQADREAAWLAERFPAGVHTRPEGGRDSQSIILLWEYKTEVMQPAWPPPLDELYPELALRGLATMLPGLHQYFAHIPRPRLDGGYYTRTPENRLLAGPLEIEGAYLIGALSGYGIMAGCAAGDLLRRHITGDTLPSYAAAFALERYRNPLYQEQLKSLDGTGQL